MFAYLSINLECTVMKKYRWNKINKNVTTEMLLKKMTEIENEKVVKQISKNKYKRYRQQSK